LGLAGWTVAAALLILLGFAWWAFRSAKQGDLPLMRHNVDLGPDFESNAAFSAVLSPDGTKLLYRVHNADGKYFLAIRPLDQDKERLLPPTENPSGIPFFFPDGQWIGFFAGGKMKKVPVQGGPVIDLCDAGGFGGSWGEDDSIVVTLTPTSACRVCPQAAGNRNL